MSAAVARCQRTERRRGDRESKFRRYMGAAGKAATSQNISRYNDVLAMLRKTEKSTTLQNLYKMFEAIP